MFQPVRLLSRRLFCVALALTTCACNSNTTRSPEQLSRCFQMYQLWARYETEHCPNTTGQRAQAEWALSRCQVGDYERGLAELDRLLRRDLIRIPTAGNATPICVTWLARNFSAWWSYRARKRVPIGMNGCSAIAGYQGGDYNPIRVPGGGTMCMWTSTILTPGTFSAATRYARRTRSVGATPHRWATPPFTTTSTCLA